MKEMYILLIVTIGLHLLDMLFTILLVKKLEKEFNNAHLMELNYHRYFMGWFGIIPGALISVAISSSALVLLFFWLQDTIKVEQMYFVVGMFFMIVYFNFINYVYYDKTRDFLEKNKKVTEDGK